MNLQAVVDAKTFRRDVLTCDVKIVQGNCHGQCCRNTTGDWDRFDLSSKEEAYLREQNPNAVGTSQMIFDPDTKRCRFLLDNSLCRLYPYYKAPVVCLSFPFYLREDDGQQRLDVEPDFEKLGCSKNSCVVCSLPLIQSHFRTLSNILGYSEALRLSDALDNNDFKGDVVVKLDPEWRRKVGVAGRGRDRLVVVRGDGNV